MLMMTPGPTEIPQDVRNAMSRKIEHPYIQEEFSEFYLSLEEKLQRVYDTEDDIVIMGGEGILGLEASIASLIEKGEEVLCISNGIFGDGFADFVRMYGGKAILSDFPYDSAISLEKVKDQIEQYDFNLATMVHCETPTGTLNGLEEILKILKEKDVLAVVDAVSSLGGVPVPTENMDICIGGSQKCFSSPPGLTTLSVSAEAWGKMSERDKGDGHFYTDLKVWKDKWIEGGQFPYTPSVSNLYALDKSVDLILDEGLTRVYSRHEEAAELCRERGREIGLHLYPEDEKLCSDTVTAFQIEGEALDIQKRLRKEHDILLATGLGEMKGDILRVGHMGFNAQAEKVQRTMDALEKVTT